jgi:hypothetical protein
MTYLIFTRPAICMSLFHCIPRIHMCDDGDDEMRLATFPVQLMADWLVVANDEAQLDHPAAFPHAAMQLSPDSITPITLNTTSTSSPSSRLRGRSDGGQVDGGPHLRWPNEAEVQEIMLVGAA